MDEKTRLDYLYKYSTMVYDRNAIKGRIDLIRQGENAYKKLEAMTGVPWKIIGICHYKEASCDFTKHLANGDPLSARTKRVPIGIPKTGSPPFDWFTAGKAALELKPNKDWSLEGMLYWCEAYNGMGHRNQGINSPYLWGKTQYYTKGLYVRDHVYDPNAVFTGYGAACFIKELSDNETITVVKPKTTWKDLINRLKKALEAFKK